MGNRYLSTLSEQISSGIDKCMYLKTDLEEFMSELRYISDIDSEKANFIVEQALCSIDEAISQITVVNDYLKEVNSHE